MTTLRFQSRFRTELPGDPDADRQPRQVHGALWSPASPTPVPNAQMLAWSRPLAAELGLPEGLERQPETAALLGGNGSADGVAPFAANYGGHQFGHWAGQLGDGRAIVLGELARPDGSLVEVQLKGAGPTPYSRRGDGRAVLRSSIRELVCSEAMHHLGVPTTRALALVATGEPVLRDMFYDGNPRPEPGAIVTRIAPTFLRFGSFELPASRGDLALLQQLAAFTVRHFFPALGTPAPATFAQWFVTVAERTARLIAHWQTVGFVHGVLNTDNMSILGLTIDYGPYGWLDEFDPAWTPNTTDHAQRRYCFGRQPAVGLWNVERLGVALSPLLPDEAVIEAGLQAYETTWRAESRRRWADKLGITAVTDDDDALVQDCLQWLAAAPTDMTLFFRALAEVVTAPRPTVLPAVVAEALLGPVRDEHGRQGLEWLQRWWQRARQGGEPAERVAVRMDAVNPAFLPRNWIVQEAIDRAEAGDAAAVQQLLDRVQQPFVVPPEGMVAQKRPEWARNRAGCGALS